MRQLILNPTREDPAVKVLSQFFWDPIVKIGLKFSWKYTIAAFIHTCSSEQAQTLSFVNCTLG